MEFELSKPQKEIQKAAREFAKGEFDKEIIIERGRERQYPDNVLKKASDLGFIGIHFPESADGAGMGVLENAIVAEQFCRQDSTMGMAVLFSGFAAECIFRYGETHLADRLLPPVVAGRTLSACAFYESGMLGSLQSVKTTMLEDNGHCVINGQKDFVLNGMDAGFYVVLGSKAGENVAIPGDMQLLLAVVESDREGISIDDAGRTLGNTMVSFGHVHFSNVRVPVENVLRKSPPGQGGAAGFINEARIQLAAMALGTAQGAFDRALDYVRQREQFGRKLARFQVIRHKIAEMAAQIEQARWLVYRTAWIFDRNRCDAKDAAIAKLTAARCAMAVTDEAVQLLGGYGYMTEYEVEHFYRDAKTIEIFMGPERVLKDAIADLAIGKLK